MEGLASACHRYIYLQLTSLFSAIIEFEYIYFVFSIIQVEFLDKYLKLQGFNVNKCSWNEEHCVDAKLEHVASLVELLLINCTEKLDKIVLLLDERYLKFKTEDLTATLSHNSNVTIVLISSTKQAKPKTSEDW